MPTDRVLIEIVSAANMSGIREAQAGFLGMSNALTATIAGLGLAVVAGKSAVDIAEKHEKAERDLAQAVSARGGNLNDATKFLDAFIAANRTSISDQSEIINGYASLTRAGISQTEAQKDVNRALDISAITGKSYEEVIQTLILAEHGRLRGLSDLGVTTTKFTDAQGNQVASSHDVAKALGEVDIATAKGRDSLTETDKASRALSNDWQDIANNVGPPLLGLLDGILRGADFIVQKLKELGANKDWNKALTEGFGAVQGYITDTVQGIRDLIAGVQWLIDHGEAVARFLGAGTSQGGRTRYSGGGNIIPGASGFEGSVSQPTLFLAGESGSEHVSIRPQGGSGGGTTSVHIHIDQGAYIDGPSVDRLANIIALRLGYATGR